jgi:hypothetical protein
MNTREMLINLAETLPADASIEDAMERLLFLAKVQRGIVQADAGITLAHSRARVRKLVSKGLADSIAGRTQDVKKLRQKYGLAK